MRILGNACTASYRNGGKGIFVAEAVIAHASVMIQSSQGMTEAVHRFGDLSAHVWVLD